jgi:DNA polymerase-4
VKRALPTIVHLDADAFFVSVEQSLDPSLRGKKVAVGGRVRGIVASASYEARACGVYTPMPVSQALRVCPDLVLVSHANGMSRYSEFSAKMFALCETVTPYVECRSIDEGFMDIGPRGFKDEATAVAAVRELQGRILRELGLPVSFGMAATKVVSAIASKQNKPRGFTVVPAGAEADFLAPLPIGVLPGIGKKTEVLLKANGIARVGDLPAQNGSLLASLLGRDWRGWVATALGEDDAEVGTVHEDAKSYSQQETFPRDIGDFAEVLRVAKGMIDALLPKVRADGKTARTLTIKVRYPGMEDDSAGRSLLEPSDLEAPFYVLAEPLLRTAWRRVRSPLRLVMVKLSGIAEPAVQMELFAEKSDADARKRKLAAVVDSLNAQTNGTALQHGFHAQTHH